MSNDIGNFKPLADRVLVKRVKEEEKTAGGIIIPDTAKEKPQMAIIVAIGPGARDDGGKIIPLNVKVGDVILLGKWGGTEVKLNGEEYIIVKESEVLGIVSGNVSVNSCSGGCPAGCSC